MITNLYCHPLIQAVGMEEMMARCERIGAPEVDIHDSATNSTHVGCGGSECRLVVEGLLVIRVVRTTDMIDEDRLHANRAVAEVLLTRL
jgi:hypothetical protein